jgi:hypothetical protein
MEARIPNLVSDSPLDYARKMRNFHEVSAMYWQDLAVKISNDLNVPDESFGATLDMVACHCESVAYWESRIMEIELPDFLG